MAAAIAASALPNMSRLPHVPMPNAPQLRDRQTDRQRNARPKPRTTKVVVWRTDTHLPVPKRRPHTHPSRRKPMPQTNPHTTEATLPLCFLTNAHGSPIAHFERFCSPTLQAGAAARALEGIEGERVGSG